VNDFIWSPSPELVEQANVTRLMQRLGCADYRELHRVSIEDPERFWPEVVADLGLEFAQPWARVLDVSRGPEWATWFVGAQLNIAVNCAHRWRDEPGEAAIGLGEDGSRASLTWAELSRQVTQVGERLLELGVEPGDRVAIFMPMHPAVAVASHACAHIGAVQVPIFSGFAAPAIRSRLEDSEAKVVIAADWSYRRGRQIAMLETLEEANDRAQVLVWRREHGWGEDVTEQPGELPPLELDSEHPYLLAYTSGTTGRPKGALHVQGGFLVSIAREVVYQTNVGRGDRVFFATDMGWIMGPWTVVGAGACGATVIYAEGAPDRPHDRLWRTIEAEHVTMLGVSPTLIRALIPHGDPDADLSSLRAICTTGEPWNRDPYLWLFDKVGGGRVPIVNVSGGTEVGACFLSTCIVEPVKAVALGFPALGADLDVVDAEGRSARRDV
jgi:acetyl-CoA synthetase